MKKKQDMTDADILRRKAEELVEKRLAKDNDLTDSAILKLNHELAVHQIELEIQNRELIDTKEDLEQIVEKYTGLYDFAPTGYLTLSKSGQITELNFYTAKILGKERSYLIKSFFSSFVAKESTAVFNDFLKGIFNTQNSQSCDISIISENNSVISVFMVGSPGKNGNADINIIDNTERKLTEKQLQNVLNEFSEANKELQHLLHVNADKDLFISVLAHDLRNPFGVLLGYTEILSENITTLKRDEIKQLVDEIKKSTEGTYELLEDLLKWSRVRTGKIPFELQNLNFSHICKDVFEALKSTALRKNIVINYPLNEDIRFVADAEMIKAIFRNLVSNALKFTGFDGMINISAHRTNWGVTFSVSDNGIGIEADLMQSLFDISQFHTTTGTEHEKGTGLGLLLCKEFVEKHGGKIWVESEFGKGSTFYFNIPDHSLENVRKFMEVTKDETHIRKLKILIAEDDAGLRMVLSNLIKDYCKEFLFAEDGIEAVEIFRNNPDTDLVLMDYHMPRLNGYEAANEIRSLSKDVVIIVETADTYSDVVENMSREGINEFFFKPYNKDFLIRLMKKYFNEL
jgi:signal transduction histidine kinase